MPNETSSDYYLATHPDATPRLNEALKNAQADMGPTRKDKKNPHFKSSYASLSAVIANIQEPFTENGLSWGFNVAGDGEKTVSVQTIFRHVSGEESRSEWLKMPCAPATPQGFGSAITYAKRYSLEGFAGLGSADDDGNAASAKPDPKPEPSKPSAERLEGISKLVEAFGLIGVSKAVLEAQLKHPVEALTDAEWASLRKQYAEEKAKGEQSSEQAKAEKGIAAENAKKSEALITRIRAAKTATEVAQIQAEAGPLRLAKPELAALARCASDRLLVLKEDGKRPPPPTGDVPQ